MLLIGVLVIFSPVFAVNLNHYPQFTSISERVSGNIALSGTFPPVTFHNSHKFGSKSAGFIQSPSKFDAISYISRNSKSRIPLFSNARERKPPDLNSLLLSERIVFIGLPIQPTVAHLVISQLLYLDYDSAEKPIKIYINTDDSITDNNELSVSEIGALNIVDVMNYLKNDIITLNLGKAYGPAAVILGSGTPGKRFVLPRSYTVLRQLPVSLSFRQAEDISIYSKEILKARKSTVQVLSKICNKTEDEILTKLKSGEYMNAKETIDYGLADKILDDIE